MGLGGLASPYGLKRLSPLQLGWSPYACHDRDWELPTGGTPREELEDAMIVEEKLQALGLGVPDISRSGSPNPAARAARHPAPGMTDASAVQWPAACWSHC